MIETQETFNFTTMPVISGILLLVFGTFIFLIAMRRRNERRKVSGINGFTCADRMVNTKTTEKFLRVLALLLLLSGFILITFEALRIESNVTTELAVG
ncbi:MULTISPECIES: hypothetical protein [Pedobacter]|uniref:Uncharacterized protein n=1 Tax=Pedobacter agri TaxID=454586 RepID=A0A9X3DF89_9SPHI|nr:MULTISPECIES: hypothetical protein [Pedobacter]AZI23975.1 hypothetical protein EA772_00925 [Pedobacter sp. G11]MCX3266075.1 hypothetical protein [Pedobacter agri]MDQ1139983.1 hypothetical protein [Pedobacter agri]